MALLSGNWLPIPTLVNFSVCCQDGGRCYENLADNFGAVSLNFCLFLRCEECLI